MSEDRETLPPRPKPEEKSKGRLLDWLDAIAKLVGAAAVLAVALIANSFQGRLTGVSIQSQREQAESQLRANMFSSLIGPIAGPQTNGKALSPDREQLIAQLLALNFNENFELKPLLEDAGERLAPKIDSRRNNGPQQADTREPLWSIARRIAGATAGFHCLGMGGLEGWSAGTRGMDVALLWRAAARKRVECACVRIVHVDRRFDTPAVFRDYRAAWVPVGDRVRRNGAVEIARPELHAANDSGAPGLEESKGHCKCVAVSDQAIASGRDRYCISFPTWVV